MVNMETEAETAPQQNIEVKKENLVKEAADEGVPASSSKESKSATIKKSQTLRRDAKENVVYLHCMPRCWAIPSPSPYVLKLESFLRLAKITYELEHRHPFHKKTNKMPWIEYNGETYYDSQLIIEQLSTLCGVNLDEGMSAVDLSIARAFQKMIDEHTEWGLPLWRFVQDKERRFIKNVVHMEGLRGYVWEKLVLKPKVVSGAEGHGIGRLPESDVEKLVKQDLKAVSDFLGEKTFLFGDKIRTVDCSAFGLIAQFVYVDVASPYHAYIKEELGNLVTYVERVKEQVFADWDELLPKRKVVEKKEVEKPVEEAKETNGDAAAAAAAAPAEGEQVPENNNGAEAGDAGAGDAVVDGDKKEAKKGGTFTSSFRKMFKKKPAVAKPEAQGVDEKAEDAVVVQNGDDGNIDKTAEMTNGAEKVAEENSVAVEAN